MLKNRFFISYMMTSLLYASVVGVILYTPSAKLFAKKDIETKVIKLKLTSFIPKVITPVQQMEQSEAKKEPVKKELIKKELIKEEIKEEPNIKPQPIIKKPKKIIKKKRAKKRIVKKRRKPNKVKKKSKRVSKRNRVKKVASRRNSRVSPAKKSVFLSKIRASINRGKSYPNMAKRRGIEGRVKVRFRILKSGKVSGISVTGARVFHKSAKRAVRSAFPINARKSPLSLPMSVSVTLIYNIR